LISGVRDGDRETLPITKGKVYRHYLTVSAGESACDDVVKLLASSG